MYLYLNNRIYIFLILERWWLILKIKFSLVIKFKFKSLIYLLINLYRNFCLKKKIYFLELKNIISNLGIKFWQIFIRNKKILSNKINNN